MQRIRSLDLARGFTVLLFAPVHSILLYSDPSVKETGIGQLLSFLAEWHGAQIFMLLMGISFSFSKDQSVKKILQRAFALLLIGYLLNFLKFVLPMFFHLLPEHMINDLQATNDRSGMLQLFLLGDILQFTALALIVLLQVSKIRYSHIVALILGSVYLVLSPNLWDIHSRYALLNYLNELVGGKPPGVFFPLMPWIIYPLVGFALGHYIKKQNENLTLLFERIKSVGAIFILLGFLIRIVGGGESSGDFYRDYPPEVLMHLGCALLFLYVWHYIAFLKDNKLFHLLEYCSRHITLIYFIQWVIIFWMLPLFGYHDLNMFQSLGAIAITSIITFFISTLITNRKHHE